MNVQLNIKHNIFNAAYYPYLEQYDKRYEVYYGGAGSGKSVFVAQKLVIKALSYKRNILVVRKVMATHRDSCWQLIIDTLSTFRILQYCEINKSNFVITLPNGSVFLFKGLDDVEKIKSIVGITDIWFEEATEGTQDDFTQLNLRLRANADNLQFILSYNPVSKANWVYSYFHEHPKQDVFLLKTTYTDNRFLPQSYIDSMEKLINTNPTYYRIYALGEFCSLSKLIYTNYSIETFDYRTLTGEPLCGLDFGFSVDMTAFIAAILNEESRTIHIYREWTCKGKTNDEIAAALTSLGYSKSLIICDSAEPKSIAELRKHGIIRARESVKGADSIRHGIDKLRQYRLIVHPSCVETITELENYSWQKDKRSGEYIDKPIDDFNHCLDALRYSLQCIKNNKLKSIDKHLFSF